MKKLVCLLAVPFFSLPAFGADLLQVYRDAQDNDPGFSAARSLLDAGREKTVQGRAGLLPSLSLSGNTMWNESEISSHNGPVLMKPSYNTNGYQLTLSQPLFRWQNWIGYDQSKLQGAQAEANYVQARQDLILRVAQAYFDVVYAQQNLLAVRANKQAIAQQLELAKKSFEVGTATITDTHEAQAQFDLATAKEIAAESDFEIRQRSLAAIIGKEAGPLAPPRKETQLVAPEPADIAEWVKAAEQGSLSVQLQQLGADIAAREIDKQRAGHYPTVDLVANKGYAKSLSTVGGSPSALDSDFSNLGLQLNIPLYQGGLTSSRQREASANFNAAKSNLEAARRNAALAARQNDSLGTLQLGDYHYYGLGNVAPNATAALQLPLEPGSLVVLTSSGAAVQGSPLSGGYGPAKRASWYLARYADALSRQQGLGIRFRVVAPQQLVAGTGVGDTGLRAYAALAGKSPEDFAKNFPVLPPRQYGELLIALLRDRADDGLVFGLRGGAEPTVLEPLPQ